MVCDAKEGSLHKYCHANWFDFFCSLKPSALLIATLAISQPFRFVDIYIYNNQSNSSKSKVVEDYAVSRFCPKTCFFFNLAGDSRQIKD